MNNIIKFLTKEAYAVDIFMGKILISGLKLSLERPLKKQSAFNHVLVSDFFILKNSSSGKI